MRSRVAFVSVLTVAFMCLWIPVANAYVDPGSGSFVFQALIGGFLAVAVTFRVFWHRISGVFKRGRSESPDS
jgi:hypothetical protein